MKLHVKLTILFSIYSLLSFGITRLVPGTYPTIQAGLNACISGDTVLVQPGTYVENIIWPLIVNDIKLIGASGSLSTIISAGASGRVLYINNPGLDTNTVISGFTLTNGTITSGSGYGAGAYLLNSTVLLQDVTITGNRVIVPGGHGYGAGLHLNNSSSVFRNCTISNNSIDTATWCYGGGVYISGGAPTFTNVTIANNSARAENWCYGVGLYARNGADLTLNQVRVTGNISGDNAIWYYGYGIYMDDVTADLFNVLVASNKAGSGGSFNYGGGVYCDGTLCVVNMMNCTITDNTKTGNGTITGSGVYARDAAVIIVNSILYNPNTGLELTSNTAATASALYSNVRGGFAGIGNISIVPGFMSPSDFHLTPASPCAGSGTDNGAPFIDLDGTSRPLPLLTMPDMGCYEVDQSATGFADMGTFEKSINIYPNPVISGGLLTIKNGVETVTVTDISGRTVFFQTNTGGTLEIPTTGWDAGWYFVYSPGRRAEKFGVIR